MDRYSIGYTQLTSDQIKACLKIGYETLNFATSRGITDRVLSSALGIAFGRGTLEATVRSMSGDRRLMPSTRSNRLRAPDCLTILFTSRQQSSLRRTKTSARWRCSAAYISRQSADRPLARHRAALPSPVAFASFEFSSLAHCLRTYGRCAFLCQHRRPSSILLCRLTTSPFVNWLKTVRFAFCL